MGKKRSKLILDDGSDSDGSDQGPDDPDDYFDPDDPDVAAERDLFHAGARGRKRRRDNEAEFDDWGNPVRATGQGRTDYTKGQSFVSAGGATASMDLLDNLAPVLPVEDVPAGSDDDEMELDSDPDSSGSEDEDEDDLAPVPGLAPSPSPSPSPPPPTPPPETSSLGFAPRGMGARGRGGARGGLGSSSARPTPGLGSRPAMSFASATSASSSVLGELGGRPADVQPSASGTDSPMASAATPRAGLGARPGIGGARIAIPPPPHIIEATETAPSGTASPASIDEPPRERRSFLPSTAPPPKPAKISKKEQQHFAKLASSGSLGLKMLEKMGWKSGSGLGANEQGIVTPIGEGQKVRKKGAGLASGERSAGAKAEAARMRGEDPDDIEEEEKKAKKAAKSAGATPKISKDAWQQPRRKEARPRVEYKTYEEIVAESGGAPEGVGMLVDLSGNALPSQSLSSLPAYGAGSADPTRLPELRHNLTLLTSTLSSSLASLAREGKGVEERRAYLAHEESRVRASVEAQERAVARLETITRAVNRIKAVEKDLVGLMMAGGDEELGPEVLLRPFVDEFDELLGTFGEEYEAMKLDEVVVGAIAPVVRRLFQNWDPLARPSLAVKELKGWRKHFLIDREFSQAKITDEIDVYGSRSAASNAGRGAVPVDRTMTAYEAMMWTIWLPRVRSAINNAWSPSEPADAISLFTSWTPLLPLFLRDNILDQLILPKVSKAIADWSPSSVRRGGASLHTIVFPWLEHAGPRMDQILEEAKRKVRAWLKSWKAADGVPAGMDAWKEAFTTVDWDALVLKHVLPQLGATLRTSFVVDPRDQKLASLEAVLAWAPLLRAAMLGQLLEAGFFPQWLDALYIWLTSDDPNFDEVAEWYSWWKAWFSDEVVALSGVNRGFRKGLDLMNQAMALGDDAKYRLKRPDLTAVKASSSSSHRHSSSSTRTKPRSAAPVAIETEEVSFRFVVEEVVTAANLLFLSTGRADEKGHALFRVAETVDGRSGVTVYLDDDVVWAQEGAAWKPVSVEEMVKRARR